MFESTNLQFSYNKERRFEFPDLKVETGEDLLILGRSGIGKTTLLHLMAGILKPTEGILRVADVEINRLSGSELDKFRGDNIGLVYQKPHFIQSLTLWENLQLARYLSGKKSDQLYLESLLDRLNILDEKKSKPTRLSQGQQQRATIAMAMVNQPKLILADEPTSSLDDENSEQVIELLKEHAHTAGASLVIITHDMRLKNSFKSQVQL